MGRQYLAYLAQELMQKDNRPENPLSTLDLRDNLNSVFLHLPPVEVRDWVMSSFFLFQGTCVALRSPGAVGGNGQNVGLIALLWIKVEKVWFSNGLQSYKNRTHRALQLQK